MITAIAIKVVPRARRSEIVAWSGRLEDQPALRIRLAAPPVDGKANEELIRFFSGFLGLPRKQVAIGRGAKSRDKVIEISGLDAGEIKKRLDAGLTES